jgi:hypothetical protein
LRGTPAGCNAQIGKEEEVAQTETQREKMAPPPNTVTLSGREREGEGRGRRGPPIHRLGQQVLLGYYFWVSCALGSHILPKASITG